MPEVPLGVSSLAARGSPGLAEARMAALPGQVLAHFGSQWVAADRDELVPGHVTGVERHAGALTGGRGQQPPVWADGQDHELARGREEGPAVLVKKLAPKGQLVLVPEAPLTRGHRGKPLVFDQTAGVL